MTDADLDQENNDENRSRQRKSQTIDSSTPGNQAADGSATTMPNFSTIYGAGTSFRTNQGTRHVPSHMNYPHSLPSCLMPEASNGSGDFEDYLQQFKT